MIDFNGTRNGEPFSGGEGKDFALLMGGGRMLPDFEAALVGLSAGEEKSFDLTFPADYQAADLAGQTVQFKVTVKSVEEQKLPELDALENVCLPARMARRPAAADLLQFQFGMGMQMQLSPEVVAAADRAAKDEYFRRWLAARKAKD